MTLADVEHWLEAAYIAAEGATLRDEDRKKAIELTALLGELRRVRAATIVDAAAGKGYVGVLAARVMAGARVIVIERDGARAEACKRAAAGMQVEVRVGDVADAALWPDEPDLVVALHACGTAADHVLERAVESKARWLLLVPCCTTAGRDVAARGEAQLGIPRHAEVRRRFVQAVVDAERTLRLEAAGYQTEVVAFVPPTVTPHNLLWRARRVGEPTRVRDAGEKLARLRRLVE